MYSHLQHFCVSNKISFAIRLHYRYYIHLPIGICRAPLWMGGGASYNKGESQTFGLMSATNKWKDARH